jgi:DnaJ-class molecular chaperone
LISAYRKKCQQTHPDKWKGYPEYIVRAMEKEYKEVQNTFKYLSKK